MESIKYNIKNMIAEIKELDSSVKIPEMIGNTYYSYQNHELALRKLLLVAKRDNKIIVDNNKKISPLEKKVQPRDVRFVNKYIFVKGDEIKEFSSVTTASVVFEITYHEMLKAIKSGKVGDWKIVHQERVWYDCYDLKKKLVLSNKKAKEICKKIGVKTDTSIYTAIKQKRTLAGYYCCVHGDSIDKHTIAIRIHEGVKYGS